MFYHHPPKYNFFIGNIGDIICSKVDLCMKLEGSEVKDIKSFIVNEDNSISAYLTKISKLKGMQGTNLTYIEDKENYIIEVKENCFKNCKNLTNKEIKIKSYE